MFHVKQSIDVVVVGGGHAGLEAAHAAARLGAGVVLVTHRRDRIGEMSCNPAIGGLGKGHLVREIDALDGLMGRLGDAAAIHYRLLNASKGPAVQGPRAQCDRMIYRWAAQEAAMHPRIAIVEAEASRLVLRAGSVCGIALADGSVVPARAVVLTAGTFLAGTIHVGHERRRGGRHGDAPADALSASLRSEGLEVGRLKTGTPPRLDGRTIDWGALGVQASDAVPTFLSFLTDRVQNATLPCGVAETTAATHDLIRANLERSAMYGGAITAPGPRYCPSIEDKVVRFAEKASHQIFLEPEGLNDHTVYPNGLSTSLPAEVQDDVVRSIPGLTRAAVLRPGYAIEYDFVQPTALDLKLAVKDMAGLFLAGQINGTTGYEEAAAQGLVAGLNAALCAFGREPIVFGRAQSYIGVLVDDLVSRRLTEPYRMFTSRAEFRLSLRADNADLRLTPVGIALGCVGPLRRRAYEAREARLAAARQALSARLATPAEAAALGVSIGGDGSRRSAFGLLAQPGVDCAMVAALAPEASALPRADRVTLEAEALYAGYAPRQARQARVLEADAAIVLPHDLPYATMPGLSGELRGKFAALRPATLAQAARVEGVTPAALLLIAGAARRARADA